MKLELTPEDTVLAVVAHPDDMEYGASVAVAKWASEGIEVNYLLLTHGEAGISGMEPAQTAQVRAKEQRDACDQVGVRELTLLDFPDGLLEHGLELRKAIAGYNRRLKPSIIVTQNFDVMAPWGLNQADHRAAGLATVDAARDAGNEWLFPELGEKHQAKTLLIANHPEPTCGVEVSERDIARGIASLRSHRQYLEVLPDHASPEEIVRGAAERGGEVAGTQYAITFASRQL
ncbi:PIG-L family deacetylase [Corynebacterium sanguinis]|uniref:PIG-L deacetylase family protein n=1 Tax=Corynebacterium sanguinis TaxID=2594913 RepID=UPI0010AB38AC|nr:PIG-L deacetylase family protein [Corynebacterium sanguinis]MCT1663971.1 PIG-L family deacetylase [Corynebacterium sanguinis]MCT2252116.1 PIG-L family deacetylase [Corynebacterium sanguinis]MDN8622944.1 PIG-L deacetylase family protein [Corynebacterium sanguinis]TVS23280.1 PIG-L family deacetylase [Corynebacterium sanguinis]